MYLLLFYNCILGVDVVVLMLPMDFFHENSIINESTNALILIFWTSTEGSTKTSLLNIKCVQLSIYCNNNNLLHNRLHNNEKAAFFFLNCLTKTLANEHSINI